ncbi:gamma-interferon-responsive lysosomal thiol protein isoform X2 [Nicotiana tabacum]|uniref:Gamma-interferon-inducible lysosomal thiol reductase isoform X2 n=1 Tax=Nicotiana tabacum TaxID=4097 RepID=A0A1S3ZBV5_TOBAC|nr:PREDICTED: gamma-interferon-inducible lysosomal thiol reductase-like isoform X2 [Nicotiana tabacum]
MASHNHIFRVIITFSLISWLIFQSHVSSQDKVNLSLYYESLCPYCADFIVNKLAKVLETDLASIVNLRLVPWGNTQIAPNTSWICQHGPAECLLNTVEACAIKDTHFKFINCVEQLHLENRHCSWQSCFSATGLSQTPIKNCYNNGLGYRLEKAYADETASLNPNHRFVPWVLVNNQPLQEDYQNFIAYICRAYRGRNIPQACKNKGLEINKTNVPDSGPRVCFRG